MFDSASFLFRLPRAVITTLALGMGLLLLAGVEAGEAAAQGPPASGGRPGGQGGGGGFGIPGIGSVQAPVDDSIVRVRAIPARERVIPGDPVPVAIVFDIKPGWHIWTSAVQAARLPAEFSRFDGATYTTIALDSAASSAGVEGLVVGTSFIQWPDYKPSTVSLGEGPQTFAFYEGRVIAYLPIMVAPDAVPGERTIPLLVSVQACDDSSCAMPEDVSVRVALTVLSPSEAAAEQSTGTAQAPGMTQPPGGSSSASQGGSTDTALFAAFDPSVFGRIAAGEAGDEAPLISGAGDDRRVHFNLFVIQFSVDPDGAGVLLLILIALVGGMLLNLTPCVLPVIPLKIMGLTQMAGDRMRAIVLGLAMTGGIIAFWAVLGILMASIRGVDAVSALFQFPLVTLGIGLFIAVMAIAMSGVFTVGLPNWVYAFEPKHDSLKGSFMVGIMTAILSTPCTGPFMGASIGFAQKINSPWLLFGIFIAIGIGMALPYLVLSAFPELVKRVPRAGPASELVKQIMGLLLLAAALYFIGSGVVGLIGHRGYEYWWVVAAVSGFAGLWLMIRTMQITRSPSRRLMFGGVGAVIIAISGAVGHAMAGQVDPLNWSLFSPEAEARARDEGQVVVIKFTAHWCLSCKALEKVALSPPRIVDRLSRPDVKLLTVDITDGDPIQKARLREAESATIPLLLVYAPDGALTLRSDAYTTQQVLDAVNLAAKRGSMARR
ncbi:MAG: thioredoxin family protein [Phycisphaeraceae bacterium]|nr:thioredoxin family protein [Phycisphaeraceae bacterium]